MSLLVTSPTAAALRPHRVIGRVVALGATTTYHYREAGGARGSTTSIGAIPAGAVVLRRSSS